MPALAFGLLVLASIGQVYIVRRLTPALRISWQGRAAECLLWLSVAGSVVALVAANL